MELSTFIKANVWLKTRPVASAQSTLAAYKLHPQRTQLITSRGLRPFADHWTSQLLFLPASSTLRRGNWRIVLPLLKGFQESLMRYL
jgi:hypothetical protein